METIWEKIVAKLKKKYGESVFLSPGDKDKKYRKILPTQFFSLNKALGIGGLPYGRIMEVYGGYASGKTSLLLHIIASAQKQHPEILFIDSEHAFDSNYAQNLGVDIKNIFISHPSSGEQAWDIIYTSIAEGNIKIVVLDSVSSLVSQAELQGTFTKISALGGQARMMSRSLRKLIGITYKQKALLILINQIRSQIGHWGSSTITSGGIALKFYASLRIELKATKLIKDKDNLIIGHQTSIKIVKNKLAPPYQSICLDLIYGKGFSVVREVMNMALQQKLIIQKGTWFFWGDEKIGQGKDAIIEWLKNSNKIEMIRKRLK